MKNRLIRVRELLQRELGAIIAREHAFPSVLVTVNDVDITPDLKNAHVSIGVIGTPEEQHAALAQLHGARQRLQHEMSRRVTLKFTPHFHFQLDQAGERGDRILQIIEDLHLPPEAVELFEDATSRLVVALCRELQRIAGQEPFYLSARTLQRLLHQDGHATAARWLKSLCVLAILAVAEPATAVRATRYRYLKPIP